MTKPQEATTDQSQAIRPFRSLTWRLALWILGTCGVIYLGTLTYAHLLSREMSIEVARTEAVYVTRASINEIEEILRSIEESTELLGEVLEVVEPSGKTLEQLLRGFVATDKVYGTAVAFLPYRFDPKVERFSPYYHRRGEEAEDIVYADLADPSYRYWEWDWYIDTTETAKAKWSEPYLDEGGSNILMVTYAVPFFRDSEGKGELRGVVTADLSLGWLNELVRSIRIGKTGYGVILSRTGQIISHPDQKVMEGGLSLFDVDRPNPQPEVDEIARHMMQGASGFRAFHDRVLGKMTRLTYAPVGNAGWSLAVIYPEDELMERANRLFRDQLILLLLGLAVLVGVVVILSRHLTGPIQALAVSARHMATGDLDQDLPSVGRHDEIGTLTRAFHYMRASLKTYIRDLQVTTAAKERMESELEIARKIQMDMLPEGEIGGGENEAYELSAKLVPARAVGGDLYYHFRADGKLYFIVGDVSGKGVPAALFMARTKTLFETLGLRQTDVGATLTEMNKSLCKENDAAMFVTAFAGILDEATGELSCASGGHDPPALVPGSGQGARFVELDGGPVLGLLHAACYETHRLTLAPGDTLVLYTDGVTEALDEEGDFFEARGLVQVLSQVGPSPAARTTDAVMKAVKDFAGSAAQSDDITVMAVRHKGDLSRD